MVRAGTGYMGRHMGLERKGQSWSQFTGVRLGSVDVALGRLGLNGLRRSPSASPFAPAAFLTPVSQRKPNTLLEVMR